MNVLRKPLAICVLIGGFVMALGLLISTSVSPSAAATQRCFGLEVTVSIANGDEPSNDSGEVILGTPGNDVIHGTRGNDVICGGGGNDYIQGGTGNDRIRGGKGNDQLFGGPGRDRLFGGRGNDTIHAGQQPGRIDGGRGLDECVGNKKGKRCEPPCLSENNAIFSDGNMLELSVPTEARRCRIGCGFHCQDDKGLEVFVATSDGALQLEHVDSSFEPAGPLPRWLPAGDTVMTIRFVNEELPCPPDTPRTTSVWLTDTWNGIGYEIDLSTCGLAFTAEWDR